MELVCFGGLIGGFIRQTEELNFNPPPCSTEDVIEECTQLLACFRGLKKGFEISLFILYSTNIVILTLWFYYTVMVIKVNFIFAGILQNLISTMIPGLFLIYTALLAEDGFTAMKKMLTVLR